MEADEYSPGNILYTNRHSLSTTDGVNSQILAGNATVRGYKEGRAQSALFRTITGFTQISPKRIIIVDKENHCLRLLEYPTYPVFVPLTFVFSGQCQRSGSWNERPALYSYPWSIVKDKLNTRRLLVTDSDNGAIRTVDSQTRAVGTFVKSRSIINVKYLAQEKSGDMYVTVKYAIFRITYSDKKVTLLSGKATNSGGGYRDSNLLKSLYYELYDLMFIGPDTLIVTDAWNSRLRLVDIKSDKVTTLATVSAPYSLFPANNILYLGQKQKIQQIKCKSGTSCFL